jgi:hypothetical protein
MDADDEALPDRLGAQTALLERQPEIGVVGSRVQFSGDAVTAAGYALHVDWINSIMTTEEILLNQFVESPFAHPSVMFRRELVDAHGGYADGEFPEDYELWLRWLSAGVRMTKVQAVLLTWHDASDRLSRRDPRYSADAFYRCKSRYLARWLHANVDPARRILVWGAGRLTRRRAEHLQREGVELGGYIDIDPCKWGRCFAGATVIDPARLPSPASCFVLGYVGKRGARELIRAQLRSQGFIEGRDFLMAA